MSEPPFLPFNLEEYLADPNTLYARLRAQMPIGRIRRPLQGIAYCVTRYDDVLTVLRDDDRFANDPRNAGRRRSWLFSKLSFSLDRTMIGHDAASHRRLRNLVHKAFTPARVQALQARVEQLVEELLASAQARGGVELMADLAIPLPVTVICDLMGVPEAERPEFRHWMSGLLDMEAGGLPGLLKGLPRSRRLFAFLRRLISQRREQRGDDLLSALVSAEEEGERLSFEELVATTFLLLFAGHETTVNLIGSGVLALIDHPEQLARLRAEPALIDSAVEELLRFTSPLCGAKLARGALIIPMLASANRDERRFPEPNALDLARTPNKHVAFGFGAHYCVGAPLARMEAKAALLGVLRRFPALALRGERRALRWRKAMSVRGLEALPLA